MDSGLTTVLTTTMTTVRLPDTSSYTTHVNSYCAWWHRRPVPTDQKVGGSSPFGRTFGRAQPRGRFRHFGNASACTLTTILTTVASPFDTSPFAL
jgi:hypothetical protein